MNFKEWAQEKRMQYKLVMLLAKLQADAALEAYMEKVHQTMLKLKLSKPIEGDKEWQNPNQPENR